MSEVRDLRLDHLEEDVREIKTVLGRLEPLITRIDQKLASELPHLATNAMVADVRTEIGQVEIRLIRWIIGTGVVAVLALSAQLWGAAQLLLRLSPHG